MTAVPKRWFFSPLSGLMKRHLPVPARELRPFHCHGLSWVNFSPSATILVFLREGWSGVIFGKIVDSQLLLLKGKLLPGAVPGRVPKASCRII